MKQPNHLYLIIAIVIASSYCGFGQFDNQKDNGSFDINISPDTPIHNDFKDPRDANNINNTSLDEALSELQKKEAKNKLKDQGITTDVQRREALFKLEKEALNREINDVYAIVDQNLGGFTSQSETITIACRDYQYPDGDEITIYVNNKPVVSNIVLSRQYAKFTLKLEPGLNEIWFKALNQGSSGPNTAGFIIVDDKGQIISSNEWNLATGAKAVLSIAKIGKSTRD